MTCVTDSYLYGINLTELFDPFEDLEDYIDYTFKGAKRRKEPLVECTVRFTCGLIIETPSWVRNNYLHQGAWN